MVTRPALAQPSHSSLDSGTLSAQRAAVKDLVKVLGVDVLVINLIVLEGPPTVGIRTRKVRRGLVRDTILPRMMAVNRCMKMCSFTFDFTFFVLSINSHH